MEHKTSSDARIYFFVGAAVLVFLLFGVRLMDYQIVQGEEFQQMAQGGITSTQTLEAPRGEILDRYGRPLAENQVSYNIIINTAYLPQSQYNVVINRLIRFMEQEGQEWIDNLPISMTEPLTFLEDEVSQQRIQSIKTSRSINMDADASLTLSKMCEDYDKNQELKLSEMDDQLLVRKIVGVRYEMERTGTNRSNPYTFAEDVPKELALQIKELSSQLPGIQIKETTSRSYPDGTVAPHAVGITGLINEDELESLNTEIKQQVEEEFPDLTEEERDEIYRSRRYIATDHVGKTGLEYAMEEELRGQKGKVQITTDSAGNVLETKVLQEAVPGNTVVTTIDKDLQLAAQKGLEDQIKYMQENEPEGQGKEANAGSVVAIDPNTGEILAMANYPSYDLSKYYSDYSTYANDERLPLFNRATRGTYMPGSIFKPMVAVASLAQGAIEQDTLINCQHIYTRFTDYQPQCLGTHGNINVEYALCVSCNIFFYEAGYRLGIEKMGDYAAQFGLGEESGIEIGESTGYFSSPEVYEELREGTEHLDWDHQPGNVLQVSIGQLDNRFSPLQLANYTATLANNGNRMRAHLVKSIQTYNSSETVTEVEPEVLNTVDASEEVFQTVRDGMISVSRDTTHGSARYYFGTYPITVAAKTGTPQNVGDQNNATFIAYAPAEDPQIAVAVIIENGYSGQKGAPVARAIFDEFFGLNETEEESQEEGVLLP